MSSAVVSFGSQLSEVRYGVCVCVCVCPELKDQADALELMSDGTEGIGAENFLGFCFYW